MSCPESVTEVPKRDPTAPSPRRMKYKRTELNPKRFWRSTNGPRRGRQTGSGEVGSSAAVAFGREHVANPLHPSISGSLVAHSARRALRDRATVHVA